MKRPTIALAIIVKDELHNLPTLLESVSGCFDEIHITDTGSTDGTLEYIQKKIEWFNGSVTSTAPIPLRPKIFLHHFEWVDDFSAARNFAMSHVQTDYVSWMDGDDSLENKEAFLKWRDNAMGLADFWFATYNYGYDHTGKAVCSFARERVWRVDKQFKWTYFLHEGVAPVSPLTKDVAINYVPTWSIKHRRTVEEINGDKGRNLRIIEKHKPKLDARMKYYYGKELFDAGKPVEAIHWLMEGVSDPKCEMHDRLLGLQYVAYAYIGCNQFEQAIQIAHQGLQLDSNRAEFWVCIGDAYLKLGSPVKALPIYNAAKACSYQTPQGGGFAGMIFLSEHAYTVYPREQLARIYVQFGVLDKAKLELEEAIGMGSTIATGMLAEVNRMIGLKVKPTSELESREDIVITAPPGTQLYEWDADIAKTRGVGGSETAAIHMAYWLRQLTGRNVKVFNTRGSSKVCDGVEYIPNTELAEYFSKYSPKLHIAWRHTINVTSAKTAVWSHDLITPGIDKLGPNSELLCLSPFHKDYAMAMQGVDDSKVWVTRNGIDPKRFHGKKANKIYGQVIFSSSPDRGLDKAMAIMDLVVKEIPEATLHVFYGTDNMRKMGMTAKADAIEAEMKARPYLIYHGNVQQDVLADKFLESEVWLYPASFIETYAITAIEAMAGRCYPVATAIGALTNTVGQFAKLGMADLFEERADTVGNQQAYAKAVIEAIKEQKWKKIDYPIDKISWESVAQDWVKKFEL